MALSISLISEMGIRIKFHSVLLCMMKTDMKCIKPCKAKGPRLAMPERTDEHILVLIRFIVCEVVPQKKSGNKS